LVVSLSAVAAWPAAADQTPAAPFARGALYGKVVDSASGHPLANATVAVRDGHGKVVAWAQTDAEGRYSIAADSLKLLQLRPSRRRGLLAGLVHGVGQVVTAPVKLAGEAVGGAASVVKQIDPIGTAKSAAVSAIVANPTPVASQLAGNTLSALTSTARKRARENAVRAMFGPRQAARKKAREELAPGELWIAVSAPDHQEIRGKAGAYWLEPPAVVENQQVGTRAWLETVKLAPVKSGQKSEVENMAVLLTDAQVDPPLAPAGTPVRLSVKLQSPAEPPLKVRVFAREDKKHKVVELQMQENGVYSGELPLDPKTPAGETTVTIAALRAEPLEVNLSKSKADPLLSFAERLDDLDADKPYDFDPRIMASENRLDLKLTILDPRRESPRPPAPAPSSAPAGTPPAAPPG